MFAFIKRQTPFSKLSLFGVVIRIEQVHEGDELAGKVKKKRLPLPNSLSTPT